MPFLTWFLCVCLFNIPDFVLKFSDAWDGLSRKNPRTSPGTAWNGPAGLQAIFSSHKYWSSPAGRSMLQSTASRSIKPAGILNNRYLVPSGETWLIRTSTVRFLAPKIIYSINRKLSIATSKFDHRNVNYAFSRLKIWLASDSSTYPWFQGLPLEEISRHHAPS